MTTVRAVTGIVSLNEAPYVLMHEHIVVGFLGSGIDPKAQPNMEKAAEEVTAELARLRANYGLALIVDASPSDLGRDVSFDYEVSQRSHVSIIACTGFYKSQYGIPWYWQNQDSEVLADFMRGEICDGVMGTNVRCGVIKVGTRGSGITPEELRVLKAAGQVSGELDVPVITHTDPDGWLETNVGARQLEELIAAGASPSRVAIGHACGAANPRQLIDICEEGAFVAIDRVGSVHIRPDTDRTELIAALVASGHADRVLLSHDHQLVWKRRNTPPGAVQKSLDLIPQKFVPLLAEVGIDDYTTRRILSRNPLHFLAVDTEEDKV